MTHTAICQLTSLGRDTAKWNDLMWRIGKVQALYAAETDQTKRTDLKALGRKLVAERDEMRRG